MPAESKRILSTDRQVQHAKAVTGRRDYRIAGSRNLVLRVTAGGTKSWSYLFASPATGKRGRVTIGRYPEVGLADAKVRALRLAVEISGGRDPSGRGDAGGQFTLAQLAEFYLDEKTNRATRSGRRVAWINEQRRLLDRDVLATLGSRPAEAVSKAEVSAVIQCIAARGSFPMADKVLGVIRSLYQWGLATGRMDFDPTMGLKKQSPIRARERTLTPEEIRRLWHAVDGETELSIPVRDCLKLQLLLGVRIGEATGATRAEIDLEVGIWTIPAIRTKSNRELRLPLPQGALGIVRAALSRSNGSPWLFPSTETEGSIRQKSASRALLRLGKRIGLQDVRTHDLRRTCATGLGELEVTDEVIERILNHAPRTVTRRHYNHAKQLEAVRQALIAWDARVMAIVGQPRATSAHTANEGLSR